MKACPKCGSRVTKRISINTGAISCQICDHEWFQCQHFYGTHTDKQCRMLALPEQDYCNQHLEVHKP